MPLWLKPCGLSIMGDSIRYSTFMLLRHPPTLHSVLSLHWLGYSLPCCTCLPIVQFVFCVVQHVDMLFIGAGLLPSCLQLSFLFGDRLALARSPLEMYRSHLPTPTGSCARRTPIVPCEGMVAGGVKIYHDYHSSRSRLMNLCRLVG